ncbi:MAG: eL32 family ribosomal protein [Candidatus Micrarchaeota archaeon]
MNKHPKFRRANFGSIARVKSGWRKPRGIDSKQRQKLKWAGAVVKIGHRSPKAGRGNHPTGKPERLVRQEKDLDAEGIDGFVIRLSGTLSKRSKTALRKKAEEKKLHVLN